MTRKILFVLLLVVSALTASAQECRLTGSVIDKDTKEKMEQTTVQLLRKDSSYVAGTVTDDRGVFAMKVDRKGAYILKISSVGYDNTYRNVQVTEPLKDIHLGEITAKASAIMLKGTTVTANAAKVTLSKDTFVYNAAAFRTPEGSTIEELVKRLPGAQVGDDGKITINGKEVKKIKVDGKEFMVGDTKTAMKNLPTSIVNKVKAYDEKSDLAKVTGIDDGNEQTVLDFGIKRGMNKGVFANADLSYGTHDRYAERLMGAYFDSKLRMMGFGSFNNTGDMGFPGGGGRGSFGMGRTRSKHVQHGCHALQLRGRQDALAERFGKMEPSQLRRAIGVGFGELRRFHQFVLQLAQPEQHAERLMECADATGMAS